MGGGVQNSLLMHVPLCHENSLQLDPLIWETVHPRTHSELLMLVKFGKIISPSLNVCQIETLFVHVKMVT